jgi:hypothetical protein
MPFDGVGFAVGDRVSKIDQVIDLLATPDRWCKGHFKKPDGSYCIRGAMMAVGADESLKPIVLQAIRDVTRRRYLRIESFNDHPYTDYLRFGGSWRVLDSLLSMVGLRRWRRHTPVGRR